ncbi:MAG: DUF6516 family protein [Anaerolineae bacterium]|nr:DUF6516 family protein [Anaerolineae bacterium]
MSRYLDRLYATIHSRREIEVEELHILDRSDVPDRTSRFSARLRFWDGSLLQVEEALVARMFVIVKVHYAYHYQRADGSLLFRYDNAPHHPELSNFPCHVHVEDRVEPAEPPDLQDVLRKIDGYLYGSA